MDRRWALCRYHCQCSGDRVLWPMGRAVRYGYGSHRFGLCHRIFLSCALLAFVAAYRITRRLARDTRSRSCLIGEIKICPAGIARRAENMEPVHCWSGRVPGAPSIIQDGDILRLMRYHCDGTNFQGAFGLFAKYRSNIHYGCFNDPFSTLRFPSKNGRI